MQLTEEEQKTLAGERGELMRKFMAILVGIGDCFDATSLVPVNSVHIPSVCLSTLGEGGQKLIENMTAAGLHCRAFATVNPLSTDFRQWRQLGMPEDEYMIQHKIAVCVARLGVSPCFTCTPFLVGNTPRFGEHIAWGEISAVIYANSVLGARTNPEGSPSAWASALIGKTPLYGMHLDENRIGQFVVYVTADLKEPAEYGALALFSSLIHPELIPVFAGLPAWTNWDGLKAMACGLHLKSQAKMFHAVGFTPEAKTKEQALGNNKPQDIIEFSQKDLENTIASLDTNKSDDVSWIATGCSHASLSEIINVASALENKKINSTVEFWIMTSRPVRVLADRMGLSKIILKAGARIVMDTCPDVLTARALNNLGYNSLATNAVVQAYEMGAYVMQPNPFAGHMHFGRIKQCVDAAVSGKWRQK